MSLKKACGFFLPFFALVLTVVLGAIGFSVDLGMAHFQKQWEQDAADAAALAAVSTLYSDPTGAQALVEAVSIGRANGLKPDELQPSSIELGQWMPAGSGQFVANATPYNAVRVNAVRTVHMSFARLVGQKEMRPAVSAVAAVGSPTRSNCLVPYALSNLAYGLEDMNYGDVVTVGVSNSGNWGKIDLDGNMSSDQRFEEAMRDGVCTRPVTIGERIPPAPGNAGLQDAMNDRLLAGPPRTEMIMPVVNAFPNGNGTTCDIGGGVYVDCPLIMNFLKVEILSQQGTGSNWTMDVKLLEKYNVGDGVGGPPNPPFPLNRTLER